MVVLFGQVQMKSINSNYHPNEDLIASCFAVGLGLEIMGLKKTLCMNLTKLLFISTASSEDTQSRNSILVWISFIDLSHSSGSSSAASEFDRLHRQREQLSGSPLSIPRNPAAHCILVQGRTRSVAGIR